MLLILYGVALTNLVAIEPLKDPEVTFAQTFVGNHSMAGFPCDDAGGIVRAAEVAAVYGVTAIGSKPL
jgi:hypothetical protein